MIKRLFSLILTVALICSFAACGAEETPSEPSSVPDSSVTSSVPEEKEPENRVLFLFYGER